ncbi:MAG: GNAT family N-acetyltransferase [Bacteroidales bacterium]|jgi:ribosomal protein S18 acetylase RimI-like enzyme|nr:GNAT family N-acetyltransferase [Bacteroidales bacterium]MDD3273814.1 GNAT family N-acetyltransferase [Bacteroidales bacterium]
MSEIKLFNENNRPTVEEKKDIVEFLYKHLENFGDKKEDIEKAINYALKEADSFGGYVLQSYDEGRISSVVVVNKTGMDGYIPENILVYIATHNELRGRGIGKRMMQRALEMAEGNVALHVEPNNPAKFLYENLGFTNKYLEMRYIKK